MKKRHARMRSNFMKALATISQVNDIEHRWGGNCRRGQS
jgi:hypothetical protein